MLMAPQVTFFPGASGAGAFWDPVARRLPSDWTRHLLSWPGAGTEPHSPAVTGYADLVAQAAETVGDRGDVVAQSMGGVVAVGLALTHPEKIRRLVLVATSGGLDVGELGGGDWRAEYTAEFPDAARWVTEQHVDYSSQLASITVPTCLIWGDADPISPIAVGRALETALPNSVLHIVADGTHMLAHDQPDVTAALIIDHLS
jgi:pimeloyl-ACP methyl ester carboxylesterase